MDGKASITLNFICRNLKYCPRKTKEMAYFSLVRSTLDYSASVWDPNLKKDQTKLEMINRRSARFVSNDYNYTSSVTKMLKTLQWPSLATRWENQRLVVLMYKIVHGLRTVEQDQTTQTSSRPSVHRHQSTRILLSSYYTSLELSVDAPQSTATPWTRSRLTSTNNSARYSLHRRDIPAWEFADYLSRSRSTLRVY